MLIFDAVVDYIAGFDKDFRSSIEGASEQELAELEVLIGQDLPDVYRDFLAVMGRSTAWIDIQSLDFRIQTVLDYYRRDDALRVDEFLRIGSDTKDPTFNPHLQLSLVAPELKVVAFPGCNEATFAEMTARHLSQLAGSLPELFSRPAFRIFEIHGADRTPIGLLARKRVRGQVSLVDDLVASRYGLEPAFWSSAAVRGYSAPGIALEVAQLGGRSLELLLRVDDPSEQENIAAWLATQLDAEICSLSAP
ncbi:hypothetical protein [Roseateles sp.]|uniref:hypothetical protein n=1 Tax=Roseateles sp. TaxID=1971397 RepID=UPI00286D157E|nr:hypothetical protein [Roseateles sp.]